MVPAKQKVIEGIKKLNRRVTATELAAVSGLKTDEASFWLNKVAGETRGKLEVANDGTVFYSFTPGFTNAYLTRGFRRAALLFGAFLFQVLYWVVRMSFGVALVASVLVVVVIFLVIIFAAMSASDSGGGDNFEFGDFFDLRFLLDLFAWNYSPASSYYVNSVPSISRDRYATFKEKSPKGNFFLNCFSFLFGDGAPNTNLEQIRWQQIARVIKENGGVVSTEQLAPYLDGDRSDSGKILSALAQFNGRPEVTKSGYIVYVFPEFLVPGDAPALPPMISETHLEEESWKFSGLQPDAMITVLLVAGCNFAGSWWLFKHLATISLLHSLVFLIDILLGYAIVFLAIPAIRWCVLQVLNKRIFDRNVLRRKAYNLIAHPEGDVLEELQEARAVRLQQLENLTADKTIVFDSDRDSVEQLFDNPDQIQHLPQQQNRKQPEL